MDVATLSHASSIPAALLLAAGETGVMTSPAAVLTIACAISAAGLALIMQPGRQGIRIAGTVIALAGFAMLMVEVLARATPQSSDGAMPPVFPVMFGFIALLGAVRMITHPRPVFAALYFILVVIATAGLFLLLGAEFMAFSLIIVYAGAILITYMFVLMLAQQSPVAGVGDAWYDRLPREALSAIVVGFVILATLSNAFFSAQSQSDRADAFARTELSGTIKAWQSLDAMPKLALASAQAAYQAAQKAAHAESLKSSSDGKTQSATTDTTTTTATTAAIVALVPDTDGARVRMRGADAFVMAQFADGSTVEVALPLSALPVNSRQVGVELVSKFPAGLEIAGVVLLMALFGAVILARKQIELGEDERRELAGMRRFTIDGESGGTGAQR